MPAGRPPTPTKVLELRGAFKKNPKRAEGRTDEPGPDGPIGDPHRLMSKGAQALWREYVPIAPPGVLFNSDRFAFEQFCELYVRARRRRFLVDPKDLARLESMYARFGMTPADRTRIKVAAKVPPPKAPSEFAKPRAVA